jgi:putative PIN family toxin of toxin-antitoxin system
MPRAASDGNASVRVVLDTNTIVSRLLWSGPPHQLLDAARDKRITLYSSAALVAELAEVIARERFLAHLRTAGVSAVELVAVFAQLAKLVIPAEVGPTVTADPDDDQVLACALAAEARMIVTGDKLLRNLKFYQSIPIVGAAEALTMLPQAT